MLQNIPLELRERDQWVCSGLNKKPLNPRTGQLASPTDPTTWGTFDEAVSAGYQNIGYVFASWDSYCIIDLDNKPDNPATQEQLERHKQILKHFQTYTERSMSGTGYHLIVKGRVPSGVNRDHVEIYSDARYMICTGNVVNDLPIADGYQEALTAMHGQMTIETKALEQYDSEISDRDIVEKAMRATNADKYNSLCQGDQSDYESQSEADMALMSIYCFYTQDNEQVRRLFRMSALGKREKANKNDKYLDYNLKKIRANEPPPVDLTKIKEAAKQIIETKIKQPASKKGLEFPPGLIGRIAEYVYSSAPRPVTEVALMAGVGLVAGLVGRAYSIKGNGLAQYLVLIAGTGTGKEGSTSGINRILNEVRNTLPAIDTFRGPGAFSSGQALVRVLDEQPCCLAMLGEFGLTLKTINDSRANGPTVILRKVLLDIWSKSGPLDILASTAYADAEKNTKMVRSPNLTIIGDTTATTFFESLDVGHIADGMLPRLSLLEYTGKRPKLNHNAAFAPDPRLVQEIIDLATISLATQNNGRNLSIQIEDSAMHSLLEYNDYIDGRIDSLDEDSVSKNLLSRSYQMALKMSGLLAVGDDPHSPIVNTKHVNWSCRFVDQGTNIITRRFESGNIGRGNSKQIFDTKRLIQNYLSGPAPKERPNLHKARIVPYLFLARRTANLAAFKASRKEESGALRNVIEVLVESGQLIEVPKQTLQEKYSFSGRAFAVTKDFIVEVKG